MEHFKELPDPRINRTKDHELVDLLVNAICTLLCGGESFYDMEDLGKAKREWFSTFLLLPNGIPNHDTFNRLFARLDPVSFGECFIRWTEGLREAIHREVVALDGKALRRARTGTATFATSSAPGPSPTGWCLANSKWPTRATKSLPFPNNASWDHAYLLRLLDF